MCVGSEFHLRLFNGGMSASRTKYSVLVFWGLRTTPLFSVLARGKPTSPMPTNGTITACTATVHLMAVPYPGRGHINPMMHLCELLLSSSQRCNGVSVTFTFVVTEEWLGLLTHGRRNNRCIANPSINFRSIPNVIPSELIRGVDFPGFLQAVLTKMESPVEHLISQLDPPPVAILADSYVPWAVSIGNRRGIPVYSLFPMPPPVFSLFYNYDMIVAGRDKSEQRNESRELAPGITFRHLSSFECFFTSPKITAVLLTCFSAIRRAEGLIFNTVDELQPHTMNDLKATLPLPVYTVGPCIPFMKLKDGGGGSIGDYFRWLDSQPAASVLYVSLGSFVHVFGEQMEELALGLRDSRVRFLWVARGDHSRLIELGGDMGLVVAWCDQLRVLCHPAVGGFMTHCGWNSTLESVFAGKPMVTFPQLGDQPSNSWAVVNDWEVGVRVGESLCFREGRIDGVVGREEIARAVRKVMDLEREAGKAMRRRLDLLKDKCHAAIGDGGSSTRNLRTLMDAIMQRSRLNANFK